MFVNYPVKQAVSAEAMQKMAVKTVRTVVKTGSNCQIRLAIIYLTIAAHLAAAASSNSR